MVYSLSFGLEEIPYTIRFSDRARRARISVDNAKVEIISPPTRRVNRLIKFAEDNRIWIYRQLQKQKANQNVVNFLPKHFVDGETLIYFGRTLKIEIIKKQRGYVEFQIHKNKVQIKVPVRFDQQQTDLAIKRGLRREANARLYALTEKISKRWAEEVGRRVKSIKLKRLKSRWGSCSHSGELTLNEKLVHCPFYVVRYVIWHEVCHLVHFNHSKKFWNLVAAKIPDYKKAQLWLKSHQGSLI